MKGIDYGYGKPKASSIKDGGYEFVCRYLSHSEGKNLSSNELADLRSQGLKVVVVWETTIERPLSGFEGGAQDAKDAVESLSYLGISNVVVYFACDDDFSIHNYDLIQNYFKGAASVIGKAKTGVYGGFDIVKMLFDQGLVTYGWQTYSWSHGRWDSRAQLRQTNIYGPKIDGVECDTDQSMQDDFGQF